MKQPSAEALRVMMIRDNLDRALSSLETLRDDVNERYKAIQAWLEEADQELAKLEKAAS